MNQFTHIVNKNANPLVNYDFATKPYIIAGGGRTGSHWLTNIVQSCVTPESWPENTFVSSFKDNVELSDQQQAWLNVCKWSDQRANTALQVVHTNDINGLITIDPIIQKSCCLVMIKRRDIFAQTISMLIAQHTDEWFFYTDRQIKSIKILPEVFVKQVNEQCKWNEYFYLAVRPIYANVEYFDYETLVEQGNNVDQYVATRLGIPCPHGPDRVYTRPNPRDYKKLIENYKELQECYLYMIENFDYSANGELNRLFGHKTEFAHSID